MSNKTALEKIVAYLKGRKTGATAPEIAKGAKVNYNTVRKLVGYTSDIFSKGFLDNSVPAIRSNYLKKCRVTGKHLTTYSLA